MEMKKTEAQLLGQLLGLLIILGILLIKIVIIYLDKKWHEKGHRSIQGIRDLPPLCTDQSSEQHVQHRRSIQWNRKVLHSLHSLNNPVSTGLDEMYGLDSPVGSENSNWILTKRSDSRQSQELK